MISADGWIETRFPSSARHASRRLRRSPPRQCGNRAWWVGRPWFPRHRRYRRLRRRGTQSLVRSLRSDGLRRSLRPARAYAWDLLLLAGTAGCDGGRRRVPIFAVQGLLEDLARLEIEHAALRDDDR